MNNNQAFLKDYFFINLDGYIKSSNLIHNISLKMNQKNLFNT